MISESGLLFWATLYVSAPFFSSVALTEKTGRLNVRL